MAQAAAHLGRRLLPWQQLAADVGLEVDPATGRLAYREVVVLVPRQSGKTTLILPKTAWRCSAFAQAHGPQGCLFIAHQRQKTLAKWKREQVPELERSRFGELFEKSLETGMEALLWRNGSVYAIDAPSESAAHSMTLDDVSLDEVWKIGREVIDGVAPTMITRPDPQRWYFSTAGTPESLLLLEKLRAGRAAVEAGDESSPLAYFEWSAPDDADMDDESLWWDWMPALGYTQPIEAMRAERATIGDDAFRRAYGNQWRDGSAVSPALDLIAWGRGQLEAPLPVDDATRPPTLAIGAWGDRWAVARVWTLGRGSSGQRRAVELAVEGGDLAAGMDALARLAVRHASVGQPTVVVDTHGPVGAHVDALRDIRAVATVVDVSRSEAMDAWGRLAEDVTGGRLVHPGDDLLNAAVEGAVTRRSGDRVALDLARSSPAVFALEAVKLAAWGEATADDGPTIY